MVRVPAKVIYHVSILASYIIEKRAIIKAEIDLSFLMLRYRYSRFLKGHWRDHSILDQNKKLTHYRTYDAIADLPAPLPPPPPTPIKYDVC